MIEMTLEIAEKALRAAQGKAKALNSPMSVTVVDEAGRLVLSARGDGTGFFSTDTSRAKAMAAAAFKKPNSELAPMVAKGGFWAIVPTVLICLPAKRRIISPRSASIPAWYGLPLPGVVLVWALVVAVMYYPCRQLALLKNRRREWWLPYL